MVTVQDKGKYEVVTGQLKTTEDYVEFLVELLGRYPAINAVIDPLRKQVASLSTNVNKHHRKLK